MRESNYRRLVLLVSLALSVGVGCRGAQENAAHDELVASAMSVSMGLITSEIQPALAADPAIKQHVGDIQSLESNAAATDDAGKDNAGDDLLVWDIKGSKGRGRIITSLDSSASTSKMKSGTLRLQSGKEYQLSPQP